LEDFEFDSDKKILLGCLDKEQLNQLEEKILARTLGMTKKDNDKQSIIYFLMSLAEMQKDREKYLNLC
jgi:hypothetical protein